MTTLEQAARQALETLERASDAGYSVECDETITALREALEQAAPKAAPGEQLTREQIREVFMAHGFTIKEGQTDLKQYVYDAAHALLELVAAPRQEAQEPVATLHCDDIGYVWAWVTEVGTRMRFEQPINLYTAPQPAPAPLSDDAKDAARYRWLRNKSTVLHGTAWLGSATAYQRDVDFLRRDDALAALDAAIDAALAAQGGK